MKIFLDMDGVLVDFSRGMCDHLNELIDTGDDRGSKSIRKMLKYNKDDLEDITPEFMERSLKLKDAGQPRTKFMKVVNSALMSFGGSCPAEVWASLPRAQGAKELFDHCVAMVGEDNVHIMTAPIGDGPSIDGKILWINRNFPQLNDVTHMHISTSKGDFVDPANPADCILIDDRVKYCDQWSSAGGKAILHEPAGTVQGVRNSINQVRQYLLEMGV
jgi:5'(3')-deoxyribonucleotidase